MHEKKLERCAKPCVLPSDYPVMYGFDALVKMLYLQLEFPSIHYNRTQLRMSFPHLVGTCIGFDHICHYRNAVCFVLPSILYDFGDIHSHEPCPMYKF